MRSIVERGIDGGRKEMDEIADEMFLKSRLSILSAFESPKKCLYLPAQMKNYFVRNQTKTPIILIGKRGLYSGCVIWG